MPATTIRWTPVKPFQGMDSHGQSILLKGGDNTDQGIRPVQALLIALGACSSMDEVEVLRKKRMPLQSLEITVNGDQDEDPPWPFRRIHLHFRLKGDNLTEKAVGRTVRLVEERCCSVAATVRGVAEITTGFKIMRDGQGVAK